MEKEKILKCKRLLEDSKEHRNNRDLWATLINLLLWINHNNYKDRFVDEADKILRLDKNYTKCLNNIEKIRESLKWFQFRKKNKARKLWWKLIFEGVKVERKRNRCVIIYKDIKKGEMLTNEYIGKY